MSYVNIALPSAPLRPFGLGALPRPVQRLRVKNMLPRGRGLGYSISATPPYFTPDAQTFATVTPSTGALPFQVESTESYLQSNLVGQMQNSGQYAGWSQAQWIAAITQDAVQRCASYPGSCGSSTPQQLGQKYGALAYQIMQLKAAQQPAPSPAPVSSPPPSPSLVTPPSGGGGGGYVGYTPPAGGGGGTPAPVSMVTGAGDNPQLAPAAAPASSAVPGIDLSFLTNPVSLFGYEIPMWILLAGAGVGVYALSSSGSGGGGRRR